MSLSLEKGFDLLEQKSSEELASPPDLLVDGDVLALVALTSQARLYLRPCFDRIASFSLLILFKCVL